jgi:hypothetical protein
VNAANRIELSFLVHHLNSVVSMSDTQGHSINLIQDVSKISLQCDVKMMTSTSGLVTQGVF